MMILLTTELSSNMGIDIIIISNKNIPETLLNKEDIKDIYLGKKISWSNNESIYLGEIEDVELRQIFTREYLDKTFTQYINHWRQLVFTGKGNPPYSFKTEADLIQWISKTNGAIGYISSMRSLYELKVTNVKIIFIEE